MQVASLSQPLNGQDGGTVGLGGQHRAGLHRCTVQHHGAGATLAGLAASMGAGQAKHIAQVVDEQHPRCHRMLMRYPIHT